MDTNWSPNLSTFDGPKYKALAAALRDGVQQGALPPGMKVPPVRDLAYTLGITPGTVARAYSILTDAGVLEATVGRGTFVAGPARRPEPEPIEMDGVPHGSGGVTREAVLVSPALPDVGQSRVIRDILADIAAEPPSGLMHYPTREAFRPAREAVIRWLSGTPLGRLTHEDIVLSHGGQNGICLAMQSILTGQKPVVLVEELSYPGFRRAAELMRAEAISVPMDADGLIPEALEEIARTHGAQVLCTSPEVHNPTNTFTPEPRRREIAAVCRRVGVQIIEDDCYRMGLSRAPTYRMIAPDLGWYVSSISKTVTPALRIGFVAAPEGRAAVLRRAAEHGFFGLAAPIADLAAKLLVHPEIERVMLDAGREFGRYIQCLVNHLGTQDLVWRRDVPFAWLTLPAGWRASAFCQAAATEGIRIRSAEDFAPRDANTPHAVRIAVNAQMPLERFEAAMLTLRRLLDNPPERIGV